MKKLLMAFVFSIFLIGLVSATIEYEYIGGRMGGSTDGPPGHFQGIAFVANHNVTLLNITLMSNVGYDDCELRDTGDNLLQQGSLTGRNVSFTYNLIAGTEYWVGCSIGTGTNGVSYNNTYPSALENRTNFNLTGSVYGGVTTGGYENTPNLPQLIVRFIEGMIFNVGAGSALTSTVTLEAPSGNIPVSDSGTNFTANHTASGGTLANTTYYVWYTNGTLLNQTTVNIIGTTNRTTLFIDALSLGTAYKWNAKTCANSSTDVVCSWGGSNYTFTSTAFTENVVTYSTPVIETTRQSYTINISANPLISSVTAKLWYNGVGYSSTVTNPSSGSYLATSTLDVPLIDIDGNYTFFWDFTFGLTTGQTIYQNSSYKNQTVQRTYLVPCNSTSNVIFINLTTHSAINPFPILNATMKTAWSWYLRNSTGTVSRNASYEDITGGNNTFTYCMSPNQTYYVTSKFEFDSTGYALNFYHLENALINKTDTSVIPLYLLNDSLATLTVLQTRDYITKRPISDAIIQVQLYDVGTDRYYTVGIYKTAFDGTDLAYLNWYDSLYKFIVLQDGIVVKNTDPYKIYSTPQYFDLQTNIAMPFEKFNDFQYSLSYNNDTKNIVLTFTKPSGDVDEGCLRVIKRTPKNDTQLTLTCETSASATIYYNLNGAENGTYIATFYATGSWFQVDSVFISIGQGFSTGINDLLGGDDATFYAFLFVGIIWAMFFITPVFGIIGLFLGLLASAALGFTLISYGIFFGLAIAGGIIIWLLKR